MKCTLLAAALLILTVKLSAQDTTKILDEIIVTATKSPIKQSETGKVVNVITREQLSRSSGKNLSEVLNTMPGININGAGNTMGTNQTIYTRGASSANTLILIDGMPLYDASGISNEFDLNNFALDHIEKIEILKGSQSTLYGSDAVAGVINIITKKDGNKPFGVDINLAAGSYNTYKGSVALSGTSGNGQTYFLSYNKIYSSGFSSAHDSTGTKDFDKDGFKQDVLQLNISSSLSKKSTVRLFGKYSNNRADLDAGVFADDTDYTNHNNNLIAGASLDHKIKNGFIRLQYSFNQFNRKFTDDSLSVGGFSKYQRGEYNGNSHFAELFTNIKPAKNIEFLAGIDYRNNITGQSYIFYPDYGFPAIPIGDDSARTNQFSGYASVNVKANKGFNIELGSRWNHHNIYGTNYTSSINPFFLLNNNIKIYGSISSAYRVPSLYQLYSEFGNRDLEPELTTSYEAGIQYLSEKINARVTAFIRDGQDIFLFYSDPVTYASHYINGDKQHDIGFETEAKVQITEAIDVSANYTFTDGEITTNISGSDSSYFNQYKRPKSIMNLSLSWKATGVLSFNASLRAVSKSYEPLYLKPPFELKGFCTLNFYGQYELHNKVVVFADLQNITDQKYFETRGFNSKGFNAMGGVRISL